MQQLGPEQKKWIAALRSGEFEQGERRLRTLDDKFCCLGVYEHISGTKCEPYYYNKCYRYFDKASLVDSFAGMTIASVRKLGLKGTLGDIVDENGIQDSALSYMNDSGKTFEEIADFIENNPEKVFTEPK